MSHSDNNYLCPFLFHSPISLMDYTYWICISYFSKIHCNGDFQCTVDPYTICVSGLWPVL